MGVEEEGQISSCDIKELSPENCPEPGSVLGREDLPETVLDEDGLAGTVLEEHLTLAGICGDEDLPRPLLDEENCPEPDKDDLPGTVLAEDDLPGWSFAWRIRALQKRRRR